MSKLSTLLERAFENKGNKNYYSSQPYSVSFEERTWETLFNVYYNRIPVLSGTTFDKTIHLCTNEDFHPHMSLVEAVQMALPEYKFTGELYSKYIADMVSKLYTVETPYKKYGEMGLKIPENSEYDLNLDSLNSVMIFDDFTMEGVYLNTEDNHFYWIYDDEVKEVLPIRMYDSEKLTEKKIEQLDNFNHCGCGETDDLRYYVFFEDVNELNVDMDLVFGKEKERLNHKKAGIDNLIASAEKRTGTSSQSNNHEKETLIK